VCRLRDLKIKGLDAQDYFLRVENVGVDDGPGLFVDDFEDSGFDVRLEGYI
jgi:hypothetical protein